MNDAPQSSHKRLIIWALSVSFCSLIVFITGLLIGSIGLHRPGEEVEDLISFTLCLIVSPVFAFSGWLVSFIAVLRHPSGPVFGVITALMLILTFLILLYYSGWQNTAAFHPNALIP